MVLKPSPSVAKLIPAASVTFFQRLGSVHATNEYQVLLVKRGRAPMQGHWGLPGGKMNPAIDKTLADTAVREMLEETGLLVQVDPKSYFSHSAGGLYHLNHFWAERLVDTATHFQPVAQSDATQIAWVNVENILAKRTVVATELQNNEPMEFVEDLHTVIFRAVELFRSGVLKLV